MCNFFPSIFCFLFCFAYVLLLHEHCVRKWRETWRPIAIFGFICVIYNASNSWWRTLFWFLYILFLGFKRSFSLIRSSHSLVLPRETEHTKIRTGEAVNQTIFTTYDEWSIVLAYDEFGRLVHYTHRKTFSTLYFCCIIQNIHRFSMRRSVIFCKTIYNRHIKQLYTQISNCEQIF